MRKFEEYTAWCSLLYLKYLIVKTYINRVFCSRYSIMSIDLSLWPNNLVGSWHYLLASVMTGAGTGISVYLTYCPLAGLVLPLIPLIYLSVVHPQVSPVTPVLSDLTQI